jgi:hypothetical protein
MKNPEDLLQKWANLPDKAPSEAWKNRLMQRAESLPRKREKPRNTQLQFLSLALVFVVFNTIAIAQFWQKKPEQRAEQRAESSREAGLVALSQNFFVKQH